MSLIGIVVPRILTLTLLSSLLVSVRIHIVFPYSYIILIPPFLTLFVSSSYCHPYPSLLLSSPLLWLSSPLLSFTSTVPLSAVTSPDMPSVPPSALPATPPVVGAPQYASDAHALASSVKRDSGGLTTPRDMYVSAGWSTAVSSLYKTYQMSTI